MQATISADAVALLRIHRGEPLPGDETDAHRELVREGLMIAGHSFTRGRIYVLTELGRKIACVLDRM